ncbi:hypothetical protein UNDKW_4126 [Undibacterium sp. KW1]|nr:hypothetical protein UNDKW_4126 [Undibacterium sp. KW1]
MISAISASTSGRISEAKATPQLKLGAFLLHNGHHVAAWRHPLADDGRDPFKLYKKLVQTA